MHSCVRAGLLVTLLASPFRRCALHAAHRLQFYCNRFFSEIVFIETCLLRYFVTALLRPLKPSNHLTLQCKDFTQQTEAASCIMKPSSNVHFTFDSQFHQSTQRSIDFSKRRLASLTGPLMVPSFGKQTVIGTPYRLMPLLPRHLQVNFCPPPVNHVQRRAYEGYNHRYNNTVYQSFPVNHNIMHRSFGTGMQDWKESVSAQGSHKGMDTWNDGSVLDRNGKRKGSASTEEERSGHYKRRRQGSWSQEGVGARCTEVWGASPSQEKPASNVIFYEPGDGYDNITQDVVQYYNKYHQSREDLEHKIMLSNCLYAIVKDVFPGCRLFIVGSSLNGFGTHTSDMDLCLLLTQNQRIDQRQEAVHILSSIHSALRCCSFVKHSQVIKAKVPILKFTDVKKNIECDLNINNDVGIRNTHLLKYYCMADPRVGPLMLYIKYWARFHDINDAHKRTISSYSLALMLIHYLQAGCYPPVLPSLQKLYPSRFDPHVSLRKLRLDESLDDFQTSNKDSLGKLFCGFLGYYAFRFSPRQDVISVREGCLLSLNSVRHVSAEPNQWKCLCIEEPFDHSNTARSVFDACIFERVLHVFRRSAKTLKETRQAETILSQPF